MPRQLYTYFRSSTSFRLRIALAYKGLAYESRYVNLPRGEHREQPYLTANPQGLVPLLVDDGRSYIQSLAIIEYLDEAYPEPPLIPKDIGARAYVRAASQIIACEMHPLNNLRVLKRLKAQFGAGDAAIGAWYAHWIAEGFRGLQDYMASEQRHGRFCCGDSVSMADICLVPQVFNAARYDCPMDAYPIVQAIFDNCMQLDAFIAAQPKMQKDAV